MNIPAIDHESAEWYELDRLFGAYLHQDFGFVHSNAWAAVHAYRSEAGPQEVASAAAAARHLATMISGDDEGRRATDDLHLDYDPLADGYTYTDWLIALADFLEEGS